MVIYISKLDSDYQNGDLFTKLLYLRFTMAVFFPVVQRSFHLGSLQRIIAGRGVRTRFQASSIAFRKFQAQLYRLGLMFHVRVSLLNLIDNLIFLIPKIITFHILLSYKGCCTYISPFFTGITYRIVDPAHSCLTSFKIYYNK
jgi:hypothetical protein